jgi:hypothetical protein
VINAGNVVEVIIYHCVLSNPIHTPIHPSIHPSKAYCIPHPYQIRVSSLFPFISNARHLSLLFPFISKPNLTPKSPRSRRPPIINPQRPIFDFLSLQLAIQLPLKFPFYFLKISDLVSIIDGRSAALSAPTGTGRFIDGGFFFFLFGFIFVSVSVFI